MLHYFLSFHLWVACIPDVDILPILTAVDLLICCLVIKYKFDLQARAATHFVTVLREYLESIFSDLRLHTITNVQCNEKVILPTSRSLITLISIIRFVEKSFVVPFQVSILLKDSYIYSFPERDQPFIKVHALPIIIIVFYIAMSSISHSPSISSCPDTILKGGYHFPV